MVLGQGFFHLLLCKQLALQGDFPDGFARSVSLFGDLCCPVLADQRDEIGGQGLCSTLVVNRSTLAVRPSIHFLPRSLAAAASR